MKTNTLQNQSLSSNRPLLAACSACGKKLMAAIQNVRTSLLNEFRQTAFAQEHVLLLAMNEAEALAHETGFPLLTFPSLAREKVQAVAAWQFRQQTVRRNSFARLAA
jgi:hypothetical protein